MICNKCPNGFSDQDYCFHKSPCRNGATCIPHAPNNYTCICDSGFAGRDCEIGKNELPVNCPNLKFMVTFGNLCFVLVVGAEKVVLPISELNPCSSNPCLNFGTCVLTSKNNYQCLCDQLHSGFRCEKCMYVYCTILIILTWSHGFYNC